VGLNTATLTARRLPAAGTNQISVIPVEVTGPPLVKRGEVQGGIEEYAARRSASRRFDVMTAIRVACFPSPIMRVTIAADPAVASTPTARMIMAAITSTMVNPALPFFT